MIATSFGPARMIELAGIRGDLIAVPSAGMAPALLPENPSSVPPDDLVAVLGRADVEMVIARKRARL